jgi:hypothetical protein
MILKISPFFLHLLLSLIVLSNIFFFHSFFLGFIFGPLYLFLTSFFLGKLFFVDLEKKNQLFLGFLLFLSCSVVFLTLLYYPYQINNLTITLYLLLLLIVSFLQRKENLTLSLDDLKQKLLLLKREFFAKKSLAFLLYLLLFSCSFFLLTLGQTFEAVRTPWFFVPKLFFFLFFLTTLWLIYLLIYFKNWLTFLFLFLHLFLSFSIANLVFPLGFGYDPFIHQATEKYILEHGFILPKSFYYLGQYSLVIFLNKILNLNYIWLDREIVPFLAATILPSIIFLVFNQFFKNFLAKLLSFFFFFLPFPSFTLTTPYNLAQLFLIVIIFLHLYSLNKPEKQNRSIFILSFFLSLAALFIHPLPGLAGLIFLLFYFLSKQKIPRPLFFFLLLIFSTLYLFIFLIFSFLSPLYKINLVNNFNLSALYHNFFRFQAKLFFPINPLYFLLALSYLLFHPLTIFLILLLFGVTGYILWFKNHKLIKIFLLAFFLLLVNSLLLFFFIKFDFLIDYEQGDFSWRLFNLASLFLIPFALYLLGRLINSIWSLKSVSLLLPIFTASIFLASLYFSYPRQDIFYYTRGFNTSLHDFKAVKYLDQITADDYVVLANQQVGAAALSVFGFRYFQNKYFFYSIPTGGPLYKIFVKMAYEGKINSETAKEAMDLTGAKVVYLYLNDYWFNIKTLLPLLKREADELIKLEDGKVWVGKFVKK